MENEKVKIYVLSMIEFNKLMLNQNITDDNVETFNKNAFISINGVGCKSYFKTNHKNVLILQFDDIEKDMGEPYIVFNEEHAKEIIKFLDNNKDVKALIIHCAAGISRSGAVSLFSLDYLKGDRLFFKKQNNHISPNGRVLRILNNEINKYGI